MFLNLYPKKIETIAFKKLIVKGDENFLFSKMQNLAANVILVVLGMLVLYAGYQCFFILPGGNVLKSAGAGYTTVCISLSFFGICFLAAIFLAIESFLYTLNRSRD